MGPSSCRKERNQRACICMSTCTCDRWGAVGSVVPRVPAPQREPVGLPPHPTSRHRTFSRCSAQLSTARPPPPGAAPYDLLAVAPKWSLAATSAAPPPGLTMVPSSWRNSSEMVRSSSENSPARWARWARVRRVPRAIRTQFPSQCHPSSAHPRRPSASKAANRNRRRGRRRGVQGARARAGATARSRQTRRATRRSAPACAAPPERAASGRTTAPAAFGLGLPH